MKKKLLMALSLVLVAVMSIGGTVAWLTVKTDPVVNTFTVGNIDISLDETYTEDTDGDRKNDKWVGKMIPGEPLDKDPKVTVLGGSEACWLFVEVTESTTPALANYIAYAVKTEQDGWTQGLGTDGIPVNVYYRSVASNDADQDFVVLGAGSYTFNNGTEDDATDDITVSWSDNQVCVKPEVTKAMMDEIQDGTVSQPTLAFTAYAIQKAGFKSAATDTENAAAAWAALKAQIS